MVSSTVKISKISIKIRDAKIANLVDDDLPNDQEFAEILLNDCPVCIANGIRRILLCELPTKVLTTDLTSIETNGTMPSDFILSRIEMLPLSQKFRDISGHLEVRNATNKIMDVTTDDLILKADGTKIEIRDVYRIAQLRPDCFLKINDIRAIERIGGRVSVADNITYQVISTKKGLLPRDEKPEDYKLKNKIGNFRISFDTSGVYSAQELINAVFENLLSRLNDFAEFISSDIEISDFYEFSKKTNISYEIKFNDEKTTIGEILIWFIYCQDQTIPLVNYSEVHATENKMILRWTHPSGRKIVELATENAIKKINQIYKELK